MAEITRSKFGSGIRGKTSAAASIPFRGHRASARQGPAPFAPGKEVVGPSSSEPQSRSETRADRVRLQFERFDDNSLRHDNLPQWPEMPMSRPQFGIAENIEAHHEFVRRREVHPSTRNREPLICGVGAQRWRAALRATMHDGASWRLPFTNKPLLAYVSMGMISVDSYDAFMQWANCGGGPYSHFVPSQL